MTFAVRTPSVQEHVPALDGVRGVAILLVMARHGIANLEASGIQAIPVALARFGGTGVDLFFVLSGWLITRILLEDRGKAGMLLSFFGRRALRIWPLYFLTLALLTLLAVVWPRFVPEDAAEFLRAAPWYWTHSFNWYLVFDPSPHAGAYGTGPFWSLAIEEQFYVLWPLVVMRFGPRRLAKLCLLLLVGSTALRVTVLCLGVPAGVTAVMTFTRLEGLAVGSGLAALSHVPEVWRIIVRSTAALARSPVRLVIGAMACHALLTIVLARLPMARAAVGVLLLSCVWGALVAAVVAHGTGTPLSSFLSAAPLRATGRISYGLYVLHMPVIFFVSCAAVSWWPGRSLGGIYLIGYVLTFAIAIVSWYAWERPWLKLKRFVPRPATGQTLPVALTPAQLELTR